jgi:hypothetical protein
MKRSLSGIMPTLLASAMAYCVILTYYAKRRPAQAISLANNGGQCLEPLTTVEMWSKHHANDEAGACAHRSLARNRREHLAGNFCAYSFPMFEMAHNRQGNILSPSPSGGQRCWESWDTRSPHLSPLAGTCHQV